VILTYPPTLKLRFLLVHITQGLLIPIGIFSSWSFWSKGKKKTFYKFVFCHGRVLFFKTLKKLGGIILGGETSPEVLTVFQYVFKYFGGFDSLSPPPLKLFFISAYYSGPLNTPVGFFFKLLVLVQMPKNTIFFYFFSFATAAVFVLKI